MIRLLLLFTFISGSLFAQPVFEKVFEKNYKDIPVNIRIENSGIYGISSFEAETGRVQLNLFDEKTSIVFNESGLRKSVANVDGKIKQVKTYADDNTSTWLEKDGILYNDKGDYISVVVTRNDLKVKYNGFSQVDLRFPGNLGYAELIGIDKNGNYFLLTESYITEVPLTVSRNVYTVAPDGSILSVLNIPLIKYLYTVKELQIDSDGNLYHMLTETDKVSIIKWSGLNKQVQGVVTYPASYNRRVHYNDFVTTDEKVEVSNSSNNNNSPLLAASRVSALRIGEQYVYHKYYVKAANLAPSGKTAPDGDVVKTPAWMVEGWNARVPYKWGGFSTLASFNNGLIAGKTAGDINTAGVSGWAEGVDCSGFVSRCWQMSYHAATSMMWDIVKVYSTWDSLKPGDAILKSGHVRLFVERTPNGSFKVVEAAARQWDVSYWTFTLADQSTYSPVVYNNMVADYTFNQPELISAINTAPGKVTLKWKSDTVNVKGYRVYKSLDGLTWSIIKDETVLKETFVVLDRVNKAEFYRVASVMNNAASSEGNWSNVLVTGESNSTKKYLVVDGFDREAGSFRGAGHAFALQYGKALALKDATFNSVKSREIGKVDINTYDAVYWISGDESSIDETISESEQAVLKSYLEQGGKLFISGSEIAYDLNKGTEADKLFLANYLKAAFVNDNAAATAATGQLNSYFGHLSLNFGQTMYEDFPDEINILNGSEVCFRYANSKVAGVYYSGTFGTSATPGKLIYIAFPLESTANDSVFNEVINKSLSYFNNEPNSVNNDIAVGTFELEQNYPNPFNPSTRINFTIPQEGLVKLTVYNILGKEISELVNETMSAGSYNINFNASSYPSGVYFYKIESGKYTDIKKMTLIK